MPADPIRPDIRDRAWSVMDEIYKKVCAMTPGMPAPTTAFYDFGVPILAKALKSAPVAEPPQEENRKPDIRLTEEDLRDVIWAVSVAFTNTPKTRERLHAALQPASALQMCLCEHAKSRHPDVNNNTGCLVRSCRCQFFQPASALEDRETK